MVFLFSYIKKMIMLTVYLVWNISFGERGNDVQVIKKLLEYAKAQKAYVSSMARKIIESMHLIIIIVKSTKFNKKNININTRIYEPLNLLNYCIKAPLFFNPLFLYFQQIQFQYISLLDSYLNISCSDKIYFLSKEGY